MGTAKFPCLFPKNLLYCTHPAFWREISNNGGNYEQHKFQEKLGGGGNLANLKSLLSVAAVLVASLLVTACPSPDDGVSTEVIPRGPNTDAATQLKKLEVLYKGTTAPNLITFNTSVAEDEEQMGEYALNNPTDATKAFVTVNAEAKSAGAEIQIWWTNGNDGGGMDAAVLASGVITLSDIPVPSTEDNTYIYVNLTNGLDDNGDPKMFEYLITVPPPIIDTTLSGITLTGASASLTPSFNPKVTNYSVTGLLADVTVTVTAAATDLANAKVKVDSVAGVGDSSSDNKAFTVPAAGEAPLVAVISVTNGVSDERPQGMTSTYTISIVPPQIELNDDSTLQTIQFYFADDDANTADIPVMAGGVFKADQTSYTFDSIPSGVTKVKLASATARSSSSKRIAVTQGTTTQSSYASSESNTDKSILDGATCTYITLPAKGSGQILTFKVVVTAQNNSTTPYQFSFANPAKSVVWKGTMTAATGVTNLIFDHAEVEYLGLDGTVHSSASGAVTDSANSWSITLDDRITPTAFVAVASKDGSTYRQSFPVNPAQKTGNVLQMNSSMARMIFNAQGFLALGANENKNVNWFLANDIDLAEVTGAWFGPNDYCGVFDGNGKTINNLYFGDTIEDGDRGVFSTLGNGAELKNVVINFKGGQENIGNGTNATVTVRLGAIVGYVTVSGSMKLSNITVNGDLNLKGNGTGYIDGPMVGGLIGELRDAYGDSTLIIENCVSNVNITIDTGTNNASDWNSVGGIIGMTADGLTLKNSYSTGKLDITVRHDAWVWNKGTAIGGLVGRIRYDKAQITNCYSTSEIVVNKTVPGTTNSEYMVGGLVGWFGSFSAESNTTPGAYIQKSIALNSSITKKQNNANVSTDVGRIYGHLNTALISDTIGVIENNYALDAIQVNGAAAPGTGSTDALKAASTNGLDKTLASLKSKATWTGLGFSEAIWDFSNIATTGAPTLK
ncbi:MAG: hypothetical protein Ta2B_02040 [Termitinemataceae bacterium]|nr:MAG: hypothetical protein Ta2B_02040 [Termitinemataceae bacterium]